VFRGTNTVERVAAAHAVLTHLKREHHMVLAATHDLDLIDLSGEDFRVSHFREQIANGEMTFDYLLRPGRSSTRNAIALLAATGYPRGVIDHAASIVDRRGP
jgi:DNA mismatch repair ATPase MutS